MANTCIPESIDIQRDHYHFIQYAIHLSHLILLNFVVLKIISSTV